MSDEFRQAVTNVMGAKFSVDKLSMKALEAGNAGLFDEWEKASISIGAALTRFMEATQKS